MVRDQLKSQFKPNSQFPRWPDVPSKPDEKAEIGILIIHGIGEQKPGQTLVDYGDPLLQFMQRWMDEVSQQAISRQDGKHSSAQTDQQYKARANGALLDAQDGAPPHVVIEISGTTRGDFTRWIVAEAYWADSFPQPPPSTVSLWLMAISPWVWISFFARRLRLIALSIRKARPDALFESFLKKAYQTCKVVLLLILTLLLSPGVLLLELFLMLLLIVGLIPLPVIRNFISPINAKISAVLGDSFIYGSSIIRRQAVLKRVTDHLKWLEDRSNHLVILGHSQGGALSYLTLKDYPSQKVKLLVTFGSGLLKLYQIEHQGLLVRTFACLSLMTVLWFLIVPAEWFHLLWVPVGESYLIWTHAAMAAFLFAVSIITAMREETGELREWAKQQSLKGLHWVDIFASADPVPNGPLFVHPEPWVESIEVHNEGFLLWSHTTYSSNVDEFHAYLINLIGKYGGTRVPLNGMTPRDAQAREQARLARSNRLFAKTIDNGALFFAAIVASLNEPLLRRLGKVISDFGESTCRTLTTAYRTPSSESCWTLSPIASGLLTVLICWIVLRFIVQFFSFLSASTAMDALYARSRLLPTPFSFLSHVFSCTALLMALQSHTTRVFQWITAVVDLIPNSHRESLLFWQPWLLGLGVAFVISLPESVILQRGLREVWKKPDLRSAGAKS